MPSEHFADTKRTISGQDAVIAVPLSLKQHFEHLDGGSFGGATLVYVDPGNPGHDFLNPDGEGAPRAGVFARVSAAMRNGLNRF